MKNYDLEKILPHDHPMILIDRLDKVNIDDGFLTANVTISDENVFFDRELDGISYLAGIEFMAQTIGCYAHFKAGCEKPKIGFLLGTRSYKCNIKKFENGKTYTIKAKEIFGDNELVSFECFIYNENIECAHAVVNAYQPQDVSKFLQ